MHNANCQVLHGMYLKYLPCYGILYILNVRSIFIHYVYRIMSNVRYTSLISVQFSVYNFFQCTIYSRTKTSVYKIVETRISRFSAFLCPYACCSILPNCDCYKSLWNVYVQQNVAVLGVGKIDCVCCVNRDVLPKVPSRFTKINLDRRLVYSVANLIFSLRTFKRM